MYRLFIDIPLPLTQEDAISTGRMIVQMIEQQNAALRSMNVEQVNYRLGHDEDRQNRNYFAINDMGHASTKKSKISLDKHEEDAILD